VEFAKVVASVYHQSVDVQTYTYRNTNGGKPMPKTISIEYVPARDVWVLRQGNRILDSFDTLAEAQETYPFAEVYAHD